MDRACLLNFNYSINRQGKWIIFGNAVFKMVSWLLQFIIQFQFIFIFFLSQLLLGNVIKLSAEQIFQTSFPRGRRGAITVSWVSLIEYL
jgi:hypothetical protein